MYICYYVCIVFACMLSHGQLFVTTWTVVRETPLSMEFSRQEYWSGFHFPPPVDLPNPRIEPLSLASPALAGGFFTTEPPGKPYNWEYHIFYIIFIGSYLVLFLSIKNIDSMNILLKGTCKQNGTFLLWDRFLEVVLLSIFTEIFDTCSQMALQKYCTVHTFSESSRMLSAAKEQQSPIQTGFKKKIFIFSHKPEPQLKGTICTVFTQLHFFKRHWLGINKQTACWQFGK